MFESHENHDHVADSDKAIEKHYNGTCKHWFILQKIAHYPYTQWNPSVHNKAGLTEIDRVRV
jgi:hypothetical protein